MLSKRNGDSEQKVGWVGILLASFAACEPWVASPSILRRQQDCIAGVLGRAALAEELRTVVQLACAALRNPQE